MTSPSSTTTKPDLVLVTGANGYIGSSLIQSLLKQGYHVRGTLRDYEISNESETQALLTIPNAQTHLELVPLELEGSEESFMKALDGAEWVFHIASPVSMRRLKDEQKLIGPAVNGTLNMLQAAKATPTVSKFVMTSSIAAIASGEKTRFNENDWADIDGSESIAYFKSKKLAEEAAWKFMRDNDPEFTLSVINPGITLGPVLSGNVKSTSEVLANILRGQTAFNVFLNTVDIRDVVEAHIQAALVPEAAGKRFILIQSDGGELFLPDIAVILEKEFGPFGYEISTRPMPKWAVWLLSWVVPELAGLYVMVDKKIYFDNSRSREILQIDYTPVKQTLIDGGHSLIEHGIVPKKPGFKSV